MVDLKEFIKNNKIYSKCSKAEQEEIDQTLMVYDELVEKATPKMIRARNGKGGSSYFVCPNCHNKITDLLDRYCYNCGQRLK